MLETPDVNPLIVGVDQPGTREFVTLELDTDEGVQGIGITFFGGPLTPALRSAVDNLSRLTVGEDPLQVEAVTDKLSLAAGRRRPRGHLCPRDRGNRHLRDHLVRRGHGVDRDSLSPTSQSRPPSRDRETTESDGADQ